MDNYNIFKVHLDGFINGIFNMDTPMVSRRPDIEAMPLEERKRGQLEIAQTFYNSHVFNMSDEIKKLLVMTKPDSEMIGNMPFPEVFIPVDFMAYDFDIDTMKRCIGVLIKQGMAEARVHKEEGMEQSVETEKFTGESHQIHITQIVTMSIDDSSGKDIFYFDRFLYDAKFENEEVKELAIQYSNTWTKQLRGLLKNFAINFLNLIQEPEVRLVYVERNEKNVARRKKQGKLPLPSMTNIMLSGKLNEYVNKLSSGNHFKYSHKFWVRGHWRHLMSKKFKEQKKIWIYPYIKGKGMLHKNQYEVSDNAV